MGNPTNWDNFPVQRIGFGTFVKRAVIHADLLWNVARRARGGFVLEVGVGSGAQSALLSHTARTVTIDNDHRIVEAARPNLTRFGSSVVLVAADAFALPFPDQSFAVAVSQGLMEHFADEQIIELLREQVRVCRSVVFSVPSDHYPRQDVGDERLLPPRCWKAIVERAFDNRRYRVRTRYYRVDLEALKYSAKARRNLGSFSVLATIDRA